MEDITQEAVQKALNLIETRKKTHEHTTVSKTKETADGQPTDSLTNSKKRHPQHKWSDLFSSTEIDAANKMAKKT